ncbi:MAG: hypothetical protein WD696_11895 [Bryobacteraceae bacterium]
MPATIFTAHSSSVLVDGQPVDGVQTIDFRVARQQGDVFALGSTERLTMYYGATRVDGRITVASANATLDGLVNSGASFQIIGNLAHTDQSRTLAFDDCRMAKKEFALTSGGHAETIYMFTATRLREEDAGAAPAA